MATRNINNYINELLNEDKRDIEAEGKKRDDALVADAQKDFDRYDRIEAGVRAQTDANTQMAQDIGRRVDASLAGSKDFAKELAAYKEQDKARQARIAGLKSGQGTNQEREARITDSQRALMSDNAKSIASSILKGFGAGRSTGKAEMEPTQGVGRYEPRESFPSRGGKNKRLARAAQADKTGDAYMAQVMGQGKGTPSSGADVEKDRMMNSPDARPESGIRNTLAVYDPNRKYEPPRTGLAVYDPDRKYEPPIPRTDLFNRGSG